MVNTVHTDLLRRIAKLEESVSLSGFNPLKIGGTADYYTSVHDPIELIEAVKGAIEAHIPYMVVGTGKSVLFSDGGFPGLVIHNQASGCTIAADRSQMIVDSGMPLQRFITQAAGQNYGGLTPFYGMGGTVGGAIYYNTSLQGQKILDSVRAVTLLLPPTKMKVDVSMVRYKTEWLTQESEVATRLFTQKQHQSLDEPQPIILNAHFQLTSVRSDELIRRIYSQEKLVQSSKPSANAFGPLFIEEEWGEIDTFFKSIRADKLRSEGFQLDRANRNFVRRGKTLVTSKGLWQFVMSLQELARSSGKELSLAFERAGIWSENES